MIDTAVIPAAGQGLRMRSLTEVLPKEILPLGHFAMIEYAVRELLASGIKRVCVVIRKGKEVIQEYLLSRKQFYNKAELYFAYQDKPLGLGDAIRQAKDFVGGVSFVMAIPDQILISEVPATKQLLDVSKGTDGIWSSMVEIPGDEISFFEGSRSFKYRKHTKDVYVIEGISTDESTQIRGFGRTVFLPEALDYMTEEYINEETGEVDLLKTFQALKDHFPLYGATLKGVPCDLGTWEGYHYYQQKVLNYEEKILW